ncbi:hypothetical protein OG966_00485 [Streptomyces sp. NBC_01750]|nr:hypothetical protein [Streptomyces sp. NBC_01750]WSD30591.1 hypothetical protein OG966_00485 [Streptomyces sp. NBC_01750]
MNDSGDCAVFPPMVTAILPASAPAGTFTFSCVADAEITSAVFDPNVTMFDVAVVEKPVPDRVTVPPAAARRGTRDSTVSWLEANRSTPSRLPAAS